MRRARAKKRVGEEGQRSYHVAQNRGEEFGRGPLDFAQGRLSHDSRRDAGATWPKAYVADSVAEFEVVEAALRVGRRDSSEI
jgi:hypothetical protein